MPRPLLLKIEQNQTFWHPKLQSFDIEKIDVYKRAFPSFLQMKNEDVSDNLRHSITLDKNSGSGQLLLSSTKLNCACKFVKNYDNSSIDTEKALSSLPRFKEIDNMKGNDEKKNEDLSVFRKNHHEELNNSYPENNERKNKDEGLIHSSVNTDRNAQSLNNYPNFQEKNYDSIKNFTEKNDDSINEKPLPNNNGKSHGRTEKNHIIQQINEGKTKENNKKRTKDYSQQKNSKNNSLKKRQNFINPFAALHTNYQSDFFGDMTGSTLLPPQSIPEYPKYDDLLRFYYTQKRQEVLAKNLLNPRKPPYYPTIYELN